MIRNDEERFLEILKFYVQLFCRMSNKIEYYLPPVYGESNFLRIKSKEKIYDCFIQCVKADPIEIAVHIEDDSKNVFITGTLIYQ